MKNIYILPPFIKLEQFLKFAGVVETGGQAKVIISDGLVSLNGEVCLMRGKKIYDGDIIDVHGIDLFKCKIDENKQNLY
ncbi:MAG: RNA-binding S4 domain-containing protein [Oscillospiraceae bacterium]|nr:RNA-binding S4 domain-containing protein [Oscillospiraceae bacterium]